MFNDHSAWNLKKTLSMPVHCPECGQRFEMEVGFWYGTGYVSYALSVAFCIASFAAWYVLIGFSTDDNRFFWWMGLTILSLLLIQPWLMRLSRVIYLYFFVKYDPDYKKTPPKKFDYDTDSYLETNETGDKA
jgi:hypothetical protein